MNRGKSSQGATIEWAIIACGLLLRTILYLTNKTLWLDEAMLALNVLRKTYYELGLPLEFLQAAPMGYLWVTKLSTSLFGESEYALRALPFVCSLVSLIFFRNLAHVALRSSSYARLLVLTLFAFSPPLLSYSAQVKPYTLDVLFSVAFLWAVLKIRASANLKGYGALALVGILAPWFSFPSIFLVATIGLILGGEAVLRREWPVFFRVAAVCAAGTVSFAIAYIKFTKPRLEHTPILESFDFAYLRFPRLTITGMHAFFQSFLDPLIPPTGILITGIAILFFFCAVWWSAPEERIVVRLGLGVTAITALMSFAHLYPWLVRSLLYTIPLLILVCGIGGRVVFERYVPEPAGWKSAAPSILLVAGLAILTDVAEFRAAVLSRGLPSLFARLEAAQPKAIVFIDNWSVPVFDYYDRRFSYASRFDIRRSVAPAYSPIKTWEGELHALAGVGDVWYVFPDFYIGGGHHPDDIKEILAQHGELKASIELSDARAFHYQL